MAFAERTVVPFERSRDEIERTLKKYGAHSFAYGWSDKNAIILFEANERRIRFELKMPTSADFQDGNITRRWNRKSGGYVSVDRSAESKCAAEMRRRWRCLALVIKAKLEAVQSGIAEFEEEFLAHIVLPNGETAGAWLAPQLAKAYQTHQMPPLLGDGR